MEKYIWGADEAYSFIQEEISKDNTLAARCKILYHKGKAVFTLYQKASKKQILRLEAIL